MGSSAEAALVFTLEIVLGPLFVFAAGYEAPTTWELVGGALLILVLDTHQVAELRESCAWRRATRRLTGLSRRLTGGVSDNRMGTRTSDVKTAPSRLDSQWPRNCQVTNRPT